IPIFRTRLYNAGYTMAPPKKMRQGYGLEGARIQRKDAYARIPRSDRAGRRIAIIGRNVGYRSRILESRQAVARKTQPASNGDSEVGGSRAVRRVVGILDLMMEAGEPLTVADIIGRLGIPKSTAYELVNPLSEAGYLAPQGGDNRLFLGRKLF